MSKRELQDASGTGESSRADAPSTRRAAAGSFAVVGIGASAGGLAAFEAFFSGMPADTDPGMAFVLVQHLAPDHNSILSALVQRYTRMQVFEVEDGMVVEPNCAYIIPPNHDMAFLNGKLHLMEPSRPRGRRLPIDSFFRSLAQDQRERAIGIILSGTGSDGTLGIRAIKGEGGMAMVQSPASAEYDGMPRSAIATGLVDFEMLAAQMPAQLIAYVSHAFGTRQKADPSLPLKTETALSRIFILLRAQTGHDFSQYKPSTIHRRIGRRMAVHQLGEMDDYVKYMQETPDEVEALFRDLLIGVTSFFRDPEAFQALETRCIPALFANKPPGAIVRVWSTGCSTGEEAYSIAILLKEHLDALKQHYIVQVFATDIDAQAIVTARAGIYPASIASDITPERLARFFTAESDGSAYRIHKGIRDMLVFSEQDVIKDPPFSRLDLLSCRNLLIYMGGELQKRLIPLFHYALNPGGMLYLGPSETMGDFGELFGVLDRKSKLFQRKEDYRGIRQSLQGRAPPLQAAFDATVLPSAGKTPGAQKLPLRELTEQALLQHLAPVGILVNGQGDILYLHGRSGMYLEPTPGEVGVNNILKMAREGLRRDLKVALHQATASKQTVRVLGLKVKTNGHFTNVNLTILNQTIRSGGSGASPPGTSPPLESRLFLVILEEVGPTDAQKTSQLRPPLSIAPTLPPSPNNTPAPDSHAVDSHALKERAIKKQGAAEQAIDPHAIDPHASDPHAIDPQANEKQLASLREELQARDEYLQIANEELETANEELKSSNEEMQSMNEELQSANEELETSKEELQSVNEELATVNAELQTRVIDLSMANNDMNNLLAGTGIATVFLNPQLRIMRFTPAATRIINLIPTDIGRPAGHIVSNLVGYSRLLADTKEVLDTLEPRDVEVQTIEGHWYTMRIRPYRTLENVIEGAVITFVEITQMKQMEDALQKARGLLPPGSGHDRGGAR